MNFTIPRYSSPLAAAIATSIVLTLVTTLTAQTVPVLGGALETVWTSDRTSWLEGPAFDGSSGIWFGDPGDITVGFGPSSRVLRYDINTGQTTSEIDLAIDPNVFGIAFDSAGRLTATHLGLGTVTRRETDKLDQVDVLANNFEGSPIIPNDLVFDSAGGLYFTDWKQNNPELGDSAVFYLPPAGDLVKATSVPQAQSANGIGISPAGDTIYVARPFGGGVFAYDVTSPGVLENERFFAQSPGGADGITTDRHGNVYVSDLAANPELVPGIPSSMVRVFSPAGDPLLTFEPPGGVINMAFDDNDSLYIAGWNRLSRVSVNYIPEPSGAVLLLLGLVCVRFVLGRVR